MEIMELKISHGLNLIGGGGRAPPPPTHPLVRQWGGGTKLDNGNINCEEALAQRAQNEWGPGEPPEALGFYTF